MDLNFTEQELRENKESIISAINVSIFSRVNERKEINKEIRTLRAYLRRIE